MKRKRIAGYVIFSLLAITGMISLYIYREYTRTQKDTAKLDIDYTIKAKDLINEFSVDEKNSGIKYWGKVIRVTGMVKRIDRNDPKWHMIMLGDTASISSVRCTIDSMHTKETEGIQEKNTIMLTGICSGFDKDELLGSDVVLVRCVVNSKQ